jgi:hypothetical protein
MRIVDIRETSVPLNSTLANSSIDFSEMTTSVVAVITDVRRDGETVCGYAFNSTGRYACGAQMRARFIPRRAQDARRRAFGAALRPGYNMPYSPVRPLSRITARQRAISSRI